MSLTRPGIVTLLAFAAQWLEAVAISLHPRKHVDDCRGLKLPETAGGQECRPTDQLRDGNCADSCACRVRSEMTLLSYCDKSKHREKWCAHHSTERRDEDKVCLDNIKACEKYIPFVDGLALLEHNYAYRMADLLFHKGARWRTDTVAILSDPLFRGTLLRRVLENTTRLRGKVLNSSNETQLLTAVATEGSRGYVCTTGVAGPSGLEIAKTTTLLKTLGALVRVMVARKECEHAEARDIVVNLRLGDVVPNFTKTVALVDRSIGNSTTITRVVFNAVLNFGGYRVFDQEGKPTWEDFGASDEKIAASRNVLDSLVAYYVTTVGLDVSVRSKPDADADLCYMATAPALVVADRGFGELVRNVRGLLGYPVVL